MEGAKEVTKEVVEPFINRLKIYKIVEDNAVLIVGGSWQHHGPPFLAAVSALKTGVGRLHLAAPKTLSTVLRAMSPDIIVLPLPDMKFTKGCARKLLKWMPKVKSILLGPGLGKGCREGLEVILKEIKNIPLTLVDDALHYDTIRFLNNRMHLIISTAKEFPNLLNITLPENLEERVSAIKSKAREINVTLYLKNHVDIISDGESTFTYNPCSPQSLTYGSLSVLAGIITAFSARGLSSIEAAAVGSYLNGKIHSLAYQKRGPYYASSELVDYIQPAQMEFV